MNRSLCSARSPPVCDVLNENCRLNPGQAFSSPSSTASCRKSNYAQACRKSVLIPDSRQPHQIGFIHKASSKLSALRRLGLYDRGCSDFCLDLIPGSCTSYGHADCWSLMTPHLQHPVSPGCIPAWLVRPLMLAPWMALETRCYCDPAKLLDAGLLALPGQTGWLVAGQGAYLIDTASNRLMPLCRQHAILKLIPQLNT